MMTPLPRTKFEARVRITMLDPPGPPDEIHEIVTIATEQGGNRVLRTPPASCSFWHRPCRQPARRGRIPCSRKGRIS